MVGIEPRIFGSEEAALPTVPQPLPAGYCFTRASGVVKLLKSYQICIIENFITRTFCVLSKCAKCLKAECNEVIKSGSSLALSAAVAVFAFQK